MPETERLGFVVSEYAGDEAEGVPVVESASGVELPEGEVFVTLPILKVGGRSLNPSTGRWTRSAVEHIVKEINEKRPEGNIGHLPPEKRSTDYKVPPMRWVGAKLVGDTAWAKAHISASAAHLREFFANAAASKARVGTSVYGVKGKKGLADMVLESIDLGHPDRLGFPDAAAVPDVTSEMEDRTMPDESNAREEGQVISELAVANRMLGTDHEEMVDLVAEYRTMQQRNKVLDEIVQEFDLDAAKPLDGLKDLLSELDGLRRVALVSEIDAMLDKKCEKNKGIQPFLRDYIVREMDGKVEVLVADLDSASAEIDRLLGTDHVKGLMQKVVTETRGPGVASGNGKSSPENEGDKKEPTDEEYAQAMADAGVVA